MNDYEPKFHIEALQDSNNEILARLTKLTTVNRELYKAVMKIAIETNTFNDPELKEHLAEIARIHDSGC